MAVTIDTSIQKIIKVLREEALKEYRTYDGTFRPSAIYQANSNALDGEACLKTDYIYDGTSSRIIKKRETVAAWSAAWDMA